jgi:hypothetical protein
MQFRFVRQVAFLLLAGVLGLAALPLAAADQVLVEAESFAQPGGWVVDPQFVETMGSPYLLAHGMGAPVTDAVTTVNFPANGEYRVWVRTRDWAENPTNHPGSFRVAVGSQIMPNTLGTSGRGWVWQEAGYAEISAGPVVLRLIDQTGFDGRCDALFFTTDYLQTPPTQTVALASWRRELLGIPATPAVTNFDCVVVGGGISGTCAALAAARRGLKVALVHDRPVLGGNASQEIRVHTMGVVWGQIVGEVNTAGYPNGSDQSIAYDTRRQQVVAAETNLTVFLNWRAFAVQTNGNRIISVSARHNQSVRELQFAAPVFIDCTGDGWLGYWAGARFRMGREAASEFNESLAPATPDRMTMGNTLQWYTRTAVGPVAFPAVPWAMDVAHDLSATFGDWEWEYGMHLDTIYDAEQIRDHLLKAIYGSFANAKAQVGNENRELAWVAYVAGKRESRRLMGDYVLTENDLRNHPDFSDAVAQGSWSIDLHYPASTTYDFLSTANQVGIARYWVPYRCLYSTNIDNLLMAGRCLSATHVGLGSPRVMNTCGQMGVAVGGAAYLCKKFNTTPRGVYQSHLSDLKSLIGDPLPDGTVAIVDNLETNRVTLTGSWTASNFEAAQMYGTNYLHDGNTGKGTKRARFTPDLPLSGSYQVYLRWNSSTSRATNAPVDIIHQNGTNTILVNQTTNGGKWNLLGTYQFSAGTAGGVTLRNDGTTSHVIADAVLFASNFALDPQFSGLPWRDADGDAVCDYLEFLNGTDPQNPQSFLRVRSAGPAQPRSLRFLATAGRSYSVLVRSEAGIGTWQKLADVDASPLTREVDVADTQAGAAPRRFYRLVTPRMQ